METSSRSAEANLGLPLGGFAPEETTDESTFVATGELIAVGIPGAGTDILTSIAPERTFALVKWAARITGNGSHIYNLSRIIRVSNLQRDLHHFVASRRAENYIAIIHCTIDGIPAVAIRTKGIQDDRWLVLIGTGSHLYALPSYAEASLTALGEATDLTVLSLDANTEPSGIRIWLECNPVIRNGAHGRVQI